MADATRRRVATFRLDDELRAGLDVIWEREGINPSEQVRRAIEAWLSSKGLRLVRQRTRLRARPGSEVWDQFERSVTGTLRAGSPTDVLVPVGLHDDAPSGRPFRELTETEMERLLAIGRALKRPVSRMRQVWKDVRRTA